MRKINLLLIGLGIATCTMAQDTTKIEEFKPNGNVMGKVFANFHYDLTKDANRSAFELTRGYFGYNHNFTKKVIGVVMLDVGSDNVSVYTAYLKNAYLKWQATKKLTTTFGLAGTKQFGEQEKFWGYRYVAKSFQDEYKFGSSADMGVYIDYKMNDYVQLDLSVNNGEGYKKNQDADGDYKYGVGLSLKPIKGLLIRGYFDMVTIPTKGDTITGLKESQSTIAAFIGYKHDKFRIGAEYNIQTNQGSNLGENLTGISGYLTVVLSKKLEVFARYDLLTSVKIDSKDLNNWNNGKDGSAIIGGFQYKPVKDVAVSVNYQGWTPEQGKDIEIDPNTSFPVEVDTKYVQNPMVFLNLEYKF